MIAAPTLYILFDGKSVTKEQAISASMRAPEAPDQFAETAESDAFYDRLSAEGLEWCSTTNSKVPIGTAQNPNASSHSHKDHYAELEAKAKAAVQAKGLDWPERFFSETDAALTHNLRERERQAFAMALQNEEHAVRFLEAQILFEEDKFITRKWQEALEENQRESNGQMDQTFLAEMLHTVPDRHFLLVVKEKQALISEDLGLTDQVIARSLETAEMRTRLETLAFILDSQPQWDTQMTERAYQELSTFLGRSAKEENALFSTVSELLSRDF